MLVIQTLSPYPTPSLYRIYIRLSYRAENKKPLRTPANIGIVNEGNNTNKPQHEPKKVQLVTLNGYLVACDETFGQVDFFHGSW